MSKMKLRLRAEADRLIVMFRKDRVMEVSYIANVFYVR